MCRHLLNVRVYVNGVLFTCESQMHKGSRVQNPDVHVPEVVEWMSLTQSHSTVWPV